MFASPAFASKPPAPEVPTVVVIERQEFVDLLSRYRFLTEERDTLSKIVDAQATQLNAVVAESDSKSLLIDQLTAQLADSQSKLTLIEHDRDALRQQIESSEFWATIKNYALAVLTGFASLLLFL